MPTSRKPNIISWVSALNDHSEWKSESDANKWLAAATGKKDARASSSACQKFSGTLSRIRECIYQTHLDSGADFSWLAIQVKQLNLAFDFSQEAVRLNLPALRGNSALFHNDDELLESISAALIIQFANHVSLSLATGTEICGRCEGLYRDSRAVRLSMVPEVQDEVELPWRKEISLLVKNSLVSDKQIQRCADLFPSGSRSKYCSDKCRFNTFQIVKQYKDPDYLAEKQRRYRAKKSET
jgi:hypothetical protein